MMQDLQPILSVSQLTQAIKLSLEATFPLLSVQGEITNFRRQSSGHLYFCVKDSQAQIAAVLFRAESSRIQFSPKDGDRVIIQGEINVYPPRGGYQIVVQHMQLAGLGELLLQLEQTKDRLKKRGLFDAEHKQKLPLFPKKIGVVTSPTGAVIRDIIHVLSRRSAGFHLILNPVKVQGDGAALEIAQAIEQLNQYAVVDVIIIARGGGGIEDLWAFNEEVVAEAIFKSQIPIISAIGHETDTTIADFVADVRAPTPSAAAEIVVAESAQQMKYLQQIYERLHQHVAYRIKHHRQRVKDAMRQPVLNSSSHLLRLWMQRIDEIKQQHHQLTKHYLDHLRIRLTAAQQQAGHLKPTTQIEYCKQRIYSISHAINTTYRFFLTQKQKECSLSLLRKAVDKIWISQKNVKRERLEYLQAQLLSIDPKNLMKRGYSILFSEKDGSIINSVICLQRNESIKIMVADGYAKAVVSDTVKR